MAFSSADYSRLMYWIVFICSLFIYFKCIYAGDQSLLCQLLLLFFLPVAWLLIIFLNLILRHFLIWSYVCVVVSFRHLLLLFQLICVLLAIFFVFVKCEGDNACRDGKSKNYPYSNWKTIATVISVVSKTPGGQVELV